MSLMKWTLALAGTVIGLRYLSDRQRRRIGSGSAAQIDQDDHRSAGLQAGMDASTPWAAPQGAGGLAGVTTGAAIIGPEDLRQADSDLAPGSSPNRL